MLTVATSVGEIRVFELMDVYGGSDPDQDFNDFYGDLTWFFRNSGAKYMLWQPGGRYAAALRVEPYRDGVLIAGLETDLQHRRKGHATQLLEQTLKHLFADGIGRIYSHVAKDNIVSRRVHERCGFIAIADQAVLLDGSVSAKYVTLCKKNTAESR